MLLQDFLKDEAGAITVDWVILTSAIVGVAIATLIVISGGVNTAVNATDDELEDGAGGVASLIGNTEVCVHAHPHSC